MPPDGIRVVFVFILINVCHKASTLYVVKKYGINIIIFTQWFIFYFTRKKRIKCKIKVIVEKVDTDSLRKNSLEKYSFYLTYIEVRIAWQKVCSEHFCQTYNKRWDIEVFVDCKKANFISLKEFSSKETHRYCERDNTIDYLYWHLEDNSIIYQIILPTSMEKETQGIIIAWQNLLSVMYFVVTSWRYCRTGYISGNLKKLNWTHSRLSMIL